jgi:hypothetical protein
MCGLSPSCTTLDTTFAFSRCRKPSPLLPIAVAWNFTPSASHCLTRASSARWMLVFSPPHSPLSVDTRIRPMLRTSLRRIMKGCLYSGLAEARCAAMLRILSPYGRA